MGWVSLVINASEENYPGARDVAQVVEYLHTRCELDVVDWHMFVILALVRQGQEDDPRLYSEFEASLVYIRPYL